MSKDKAVSFDGFSDNWFRKTTKYELLCGWWGHSILHILGDSPFRARLIPLNKVWPTIPCADKFRTIVVINPLVNWLESRFLFNIRTYLISRLDRH